MNSQPDLSHEIVITPAFHDIDPMLVVWHGNYVRYMEVARCALLAKFDYDYPQMSDSGYAWPVVDMRIKYVRSLRYGQKINVRVTITEWENRLKMEYLFTDAQTGEKLTTGYTIQVAVAMSSGDMQYVCPEVLWQRLGVDGGEKVGK